MSAASAAIRRCPTGSNCGWSPTICAKGPPSTPSRSPRPWSSAISPARRRAGAPHRRRARPKHDACPPPSPRPPPPIAFAHGEAGRGRRADAMTLSREAAASAGIATGSRFLGFPVTPLTRRRLEAFRRNRRGFWSLWIFLALFAITLPAEFIANDRPIIVHYAGGWYFPVLFDYPETAFGGVFPTETDYRDPVVRRLIDKKGWMIWPPIPFHYDTINYNLPSPAPSPPTRTDLLGTDDQGRDVLARLIYGFRISVLFGLVLTAASSLLGIAAGAVQGYFGGLIDLGFQRFMEIWSGLPVLYLLIILASFVQPNFWWLLGLMLLFSWMSLVDVVRAEFLRARNFDYVRAARALGVSNRVIIFRHVLPNAAVATITFMPFLLNASITTLTSLDFLGFGLPPGSPSLGELLAQGKDNLQAPWLGITAFTVLALMLSLLNFVGEAVRDAFDPRRCSHEHPGGARPQRHLRGVGRLQAGGGGQARLLHSGARRDPCPRRRKRLGQIGDGAVAAPASPLPRRGARSGQQHPLCRRGDDRRSAGAAARNPRQPHRHRLPGADDLAQPAAHAGKADRRDIAYPPPHVGRSGAGAHPGAAPARRAARGREPAQRLSAPALRRSAASGDDRDGDRQRARHPDRRRADDGARRHHPGADSRFDARPARPARHGAAADHPRPVDRAPHGRPGLRDDPWRDRRGGTDRADLRGAAAPLYPAPARRRAEGPGGAGRSRGADPGRGARAQGVVPDPPRPAAARHRTRQGGRLGLAHGAPGDDARRRRRERLGQDHPRAGSAATGRSRGRHRLRRARHHGAAAETAPPPAQGNADRLSGPVFEPVAAHVGVADRQRGAARAPAFGQRRGRAPADRDGARRGRARPGRGRALPPRILGRPAPAHRHRPRAGAEAALSRARRADLGARHVGAGADRRPPARLAGAPSPRLPVHQPRPQGGARPGARDRRDQGRQGGRKRRDRTGDDRAAAPLYQGADGGGVRPRRGGRTGLSGAQGSTTMSTRRSATLGSSEAVWPTATWRNVFGSSPCRSSASATTWVRVSDRCALAFGEPVALARPSMRMAEAWIALARVAASAMTWCACGVMLALNSSK